MLPMILSVALFAVPASPPPVLKLSAQGKTSVAVACQCATGGNCACVTCTCTQTVAFIDPEKGGTTAPALKAGECAPGWRKALPGETYDHVITKDGRVVALGYTAGGSCANGQCAAGRQVTAGGGCASGSCGMSAGGGCASGSCGAGGCASGSCGQARGGLFGRRR